MIYICRKSIPDSHDLLILDLIFSLGDRAAISSSYPPSSVVAPCTESLSQEQSRRPVIETYESLVRVMNGGIWSIFNGFSKYREMISMKDR